MIGIEGHAITTDVITIVEIDLVVSVATIEVAIVGQIVRTGTESLDLVIAPNEGSLMITSKSMTMRSESIRNNDDINRVVVLSAPLPIHGNFVGLNEGIIQYMYITLAWLWP